MRCLRDTNDYTARRKAFYVKRLAGDVLDRANKGPEQA